MTITCTKCQRKKSGLGRCRCTAVRRGWEAQGRRERKPQQYVANPANKAHKWCSCGALVRDGKCVSATCGKAA